MKKIILFAAIVFCTLMLNAQVHINTYIVGGVSLPNFKYSNNYGKDVYPRNVYQGYTAGAFAQTSLFGSQMGMTFGLNYIQAGAIDKAPLDPLYKETKVRLNYLQGEFYLSTSIKFIELCGGLYLDYALNGKKIITKLDGTTNTSDIKFGIYSDVAEVHRDDFGVSLKTIINISKMKLIVGYNYGINNINTNPEEDVRNKVYTISVAYPLSKKK